MNRKTYLLFALFLVVFAIFALLHYDGLQRYLIALPCLVGAFLLDNQASSLAHRDADENVEETNLFTESKKKDRTQALKALLMNKNPMVLTDVVNQLLKDLGIDVSPVPDSRTVDRILQVPGVEAKFGLVVVDDVSKLDQDWKKWDAVEDFDLGEGGEQRSLIIASNGATDQGETKTKYKKFSDDAQSLLSAKHVVAMTTRTFGQIYKTCKKKKVSPKKIFRLIHQHPGGVFPS